MVQMILGIHSCCEHGYPPEITHLIPTLLIMSKSRRVSETTTLSACLRLVSTRLLSLLPRLFLGRALLLYLDGAHVPRESTLKGSIVEVEKIQPCSKCSKCVSGPENQGGSRAR